MNTTIVDTHALDDVKKYVDKNIFNLANRLGKIIVGEIKGVLKDKKIIASKLLYKNIVYDVQRKIANEIILTAGPNRKKVLNWSGKPYAGAVNYGRKSGSVPYSAIEKWLRYKIDKGYMQLKYKKTMAQAVFLITRKIKQKRTVGTKFMEIALKRALPKIKTEIIQAGLTFIEG